MSPPTIHIQMPRKDQHAVQLNVTSIPEKPPFSTSLLESHLSMVGLLHGPNTKSNPRQITMAESGCPASLIRLTSCPDVDCKRLAVMTLCNLTANAETRAAATRGGGLQAAVRLTSDGDGECRRYAATCVCNMANDHQMQASGTRNPTASEQLRIAARYRWEVVMGRIVSVRNGISCQRYNP